MAIVMEVLTGESLAMPSVTPAMNNIISLVYNIIIQLFVRGWAHTRSFSFMGHSEDRPLSTQLTTRISHTTLDASTVDILYMHGTNIRFRTCKRIDN